MVYVIIVLIKPITQFEMKTRLVWCESLYRRKWRFLQIHLRETKHTFGWPLVVVCMQSPETAGTIKQYVSALVWYTIMQSQREGTGLDDGLHWNGRTRCWASWRRARNWNSKSQMRVVFSSWEQNLAPGTTKGRKRTGKRRIFHISLFSNRTETCNWRFAEYNPFLSQYGRDIISSTLRAE